MKADTKIVISIESLDKLNAIVTRFEEAVNQLQLLNNSVTTIPMKIEPLTIEVDGKCLKDFDSLIEINK